MSKKFLQKLILSIAIMVASNLSYISPAIAVWDLVLDDAYTIRTVILQNSKQHEQLINIDKQMKVELDKGNMNKWASLYQSTHILEGLKPEIVARKHNIWTLNDVDDVVKYNMIFLHYSLNRSEDIKTCYWNLVPLDGYNSETPITRYQLQGTDGIMTIRGHR